MGSAVSHVENAQSDAAELEMSKLPPASSHVAPEGEVLPQSGGVAATTMEY